MGERFENVLKDFKGLVSKARLKGIALRNDKEAMGLVKATTF